MTEEIRYKHDMGGNEHAGDEPATGKPGRHSSDSHPHRRHLLLAEMSREEAVRRLRAFHRLARLINDSHPSVERMCSAAARLVSEMIGDLCVITLLDSEGEQYHIAGYHDPDPEIRSMYETALQEVGPIRKEKGWTSEVMETGQPLRTGPLSDEAVRARAVPAFEEFNRRTGVADMLIVPVSGRSGTLGAIAVRRHAGGRSYDENDQSFLMEIAYWVGAALESFTLIDSLRKELAGRAYAREALAASEARFLSIFHSALFGIKAMDLVGNLLETNDAFHAMSGYAESELIAMHFYDLVHPDDLAHVLEAFKNVKMGRQPFTRSEHRLLCKDGTPIWVRTTFAGVRQIGNDGGLSLIFGMVENISDQKRAEQELRELQQHLQQSIEMERLRLAQNLHDAPLQELYAVIYKLEEVRLKSKDPESVALLRQSVVEIKKTLESLRSTASELRPPALSRFGLEKAILSYAEDFKLKHPEIEMQCTLAHDRELLPEPMRLVLFRVFQEALANVVRHAQATQVRVFFSFDAEEARIEIADNGKGFAVPPNWMSNVRMQHYGLAGMAERVSGAGGKLTIDSAPGASTTVRAVLPCPS